MIHAHVCGFSTKKGEPNHHIDIEISQLQFGRGNSEPDSTSPKRDSEEDDVIAGPKIRSDFKKLFGRPIIIKTTCKTAAEEEKDDYFHASFTAISYSLTIGALPSTNRRMLGPACPPQPGLYSDDNGDNVDSMHFAVGNQKSAEVDGVKQLSEQEEKRWKGIERNWWGNLDPGKDCQFSQATASATPNPFNSSKKRLPHDQPRKSNT
ncbi:hypothetical protein L218DRAFT_948552 [Marasmius fiardii PR-910]|nr:hypothetical protein L218DRAFT_948552 [Marasmius fiardii PR-910]